MRKGKGPEKVLEHLRKHIHGGGRLLLDGLDRDELGALYALLLEGDVEIIDEACKPYVVRKLPRW